MSRIRCVKPEFWTSEQVVSCSRNARLLFIGLWNFCDDAGIHPASCLRLKMEFFPADDCQEKEIKCWINELINNGLLREYMVNSKAYWQVTGWNHQRIDKPTFRHPQPKAENIQDASSITLRAGDNISQTAFHTPYDQSHTERNGEERIVTKELLPHHEDSANHIEHDFCKNGFPYPPCPHQEIINLYHKILSICRPVRAWNKSRRAYLQQRWKENTKHQTLEFWQGYFEYVKQSNFLTGKTSSREGKPPFIVDLEWLVRPNNFAKVIEGKYHGGQQP